LTRRLVVGSRSLSDGTFTGQLVSGDALRVLQTLSRHPEHNAESARQVTACYIDPPFNTGENFRYYTDALDRALWLTMMRDRLSLVSELLAPDGSVWVHLDDSEQHRGRCLLDEIFGPEAFVATVIWQKRTSRDNRKAFSSMHDYIHVYCPSGPKAFRKRRNPLPDTGAFANPDGDPNGPWRSAPMSAQAGHGTASQFYSLRSPAGVRHDPPPGRCWTYSQARLEELDAAGRVYWPKDGRGKPRLKQYQQDAGGLAPFTLWMADEVGDNARAKKDLLTLFGHDPVFDTPKPEGLLERIVHISSDPGDLVLDFFAGSGTTLAVAHKMQRRWIGVECSQAVVDMCTVPRLRRVVEGTDPTGVSRSTGWKGGGGFEVFDVGTASEQQAG